MKKLILMMVLFVSVAGYAQNKTATPQKGNPAIESKNVAIAEIAELVVNERKQIIEFWMLNNTPEGELVREFETLSAALNQVMAQGFEVMTSYTKVENGVTSEVHFVLQRKLDQKKPTASKPSTPSTPTASPEKQKSKKKKK